MFPVATSQIEEMKQTEYLKTKIREAFNIIDYQNTGRIPETEVSYVMRYLNAFPSEAQVREYILAKLEDDEPSDEIKYEKFEPFMLEALKSKEFEPAPAEHLLAAFKLLDPDGKGYIQEDVLRNLLTTKGIKFEAEQYKDFKTYAIDKTGQYFYYEDYVAKLMDENEEQMQLLLKDYPNFKVNKT